MKQPIRVQIGTPVIFVSEDMDADLLRVSVERRQRGGVIVTHRSAELVSMKAQEWVHPKDGETV